MEHFAEALKDNKSLKKAILSSNLIDDHAMQILVEGLGRNKSLETLLLAGNPFGDMGMRRLVQCLSEKGTSIRVRAHARALFSGCEGAGASVLLLPPTRWNGI